MAGFLHFMRCLGGATVNNVGKALAALVPGGEVVVGIVRDTWKRYWSTKQQNQPLPTASPQGPLGVGPDKPRPRKGRPGGHFGTIIAVAPLALLLLGFGSLCYFYEVRDRQRRADNERDCKELLRLASEGRETEAQERLAALLVEEPGRQTDLGKRLDREGDARRKRGAWEQAARAYGLAGRCGLIDRLEMAAGSLERAGTHYLNAKELRQARDCYLRAAAMYLTAMAAYTQEGQVRDANNCARQEEECSKAAKSCEQAP